MNWSIYRVIALAIIVLNAACSERAENSAGSDQQDSYGDKLGAISFPASCSDEAQPYIQRGFALLHHMTYLGAELQFSNATKADPDCAIGYWGQAMSYLHPLWPDIPSDAKMQNAQELLAKAASIDNKSEREAGYIAAASGYYNDAQNRSDRERLSGFKQAWEQVYRDNPDDLDAAAFYALALMATATPDTQGLAIKSEAGGIAEAVLHKSPAHPGANHYIIHAYDTPSFAEQALTVARQYGDVAPDVPHALHMPTHIFTRLGLWPDSARMNQRSAAAAREGLNAEIVSSEYLHAVDYLVYAYLQMAQDDKAADLRDQILDLQGPYGEMSRPVSAYALAAIPARYALERRDWAAGAAVSPQSPASFPWNPTYAPYEAVSWFASGIAAARNGDLDVAHNAREHLAKLSEQVASTSSNGYWTTQIEIQVQAIDAWVTLAEDDSEQAVALMQEAATREASIDKHPVTPSEILPAQELLGDMLLEVGDPEAALQAYRAELNRSRNRFNSLYGAGAAAQAIGDSEAATGYFSKLVEMCAEGATDRPRLAQARTYLASNGAEG